MIKILFISHEATRTGAPILLLNLVKWISKEKQNEYLVTVLFVKGGALINEFNKHSETYLLYKYNKPKNLLTRIKNRVGKNKNEDFYKRKWDLIFSNTIVNGKVLETIKKFSTAPIISYIHELDYSINLFLKRGAAQGTLEYSDYFLCGSELVCNNLINNYNINREKTRVVYSFSNDLINKKDKNVTYQLKEELKLPKDSLIVGMAGTMDWRKGIDIFVNTASLLEKENIYFLWIGADNTSEIRKINYDLEKSNKNLKIIFIPSSLDYKKYFNIIDVFYLSSREDPYPLVMVDATTFGIPVICFKNAGGSQEFIDEKTGFVVPYVDKQEAANKIQYYNKNKHLLKEYSEHIKKKSKEKHDISINALKITAIINKFIN